MCDLAETYGIYDYKKFKPGYIAELLAGLRENSRVKMKISGAQVPIDTMLNAAILDTLNLLLWTKTKDGAKGRNRPNSVMQELTGKNKKEELLSFSTPEEYEEHMRRIRS